jgi:glycopeptide antibiotics resistance protein
MRRRGSRKPVTTLRLAAVLYAVLLVAITLLPLRWDPWRTSYPTDNYKPQLMPLRGSGTNPLRSSHPLHMMAEQLSNILLFVPFGFLLPLLWPRLNTPWRVIGLGALISLGIELAQVVMPGIHRADVNDVLLNTLGTSLGCLGLRWTGWWRVTERFVGDDQV